MRRNLSYANVVATLALALALAGGTAYAAQKFVSKPKQLARGVVTNGKVREGTLGADRLRPAAREELTGRQGPAGPEGAPGAPGPTASAYSLEFFGPDLTPSFETVQNLSSDHDEGSGEIELDFAGRIMAVATISVENTDDVASFAHCRLQVEDEAGVFVDAGAEGQQRVGPVDREDASVAVSASVSRAPGSYDVRVQCRSAGPSYLYRHGSLIVWGVAA